MADNAYLETLARMEPDIAMVDTGGALASIAISLKRIADVLDKPNNDLCGNSLAECVYGIMMNGKTQ